MTKEFWDERFSKNEYAYGLKPNEFFKTELEKLTPGKLLLPAEGEGRNAVYAASLGWDVTAFDISTQGKTKALQLSSEYNVSINYINCSIDDIEKYNDKYDAIALIFVHQPPVIRERLHNNCIDMLKPEGKLILEGFEKDQLSLKSFGPKDSSLLFSQKELENDFGKLNSLKTEKKLVTLDEGKHHQGKAFLVRLSGKKQV